jgi:signal transduction histidine kinase
MNLPRSPRSKLFRTSSFRLTLLYAGLTASSFLLLFAVIYWSTTAFMQEQIDTTVTNEIKELRSASAADDLDSLRRAVQASAAQSSAFFYLLQDRDGRVLAGDLPSLSPVTGVREWIGPNRLQTQPGTDIRGRGVDAEGGAYLLVALNAHQLHEMKESVSRSFLWGFGAAMLLALVGGAAMSLSVMRRIEAVSQTSRDIIRGDLQRRIPLSGSGDEFDHLAASLNAMLDRIGVLMEGLRQVSTDIAHDLRTPLTRLRQRLELAREIPPDPAQQQAVQLHASLGTTLTDIDAILETFSALLRIAQIESGTRKASFNRVDLSELLHTVAEVYQPALDEKSQSLRDEIAPNLALYGDRELLTQMFANLMENATRHCPIGSRIGLRAERHGSGVEVTIDDNGAGIPEALRDKVLQRFVRLDASRSTPGNGLGLSMALAVAMLHDARLTLSDNHPGLHVSVVFDQSSESSAA